MTIKEFNANHFYVHQNVYVVEDRIIDTSDLEKGGADTLNECEYDVADSYDTEDNTTYDITNQAGDVIVGNLPDEASVMGAIENLKKWHHVT